MKFKYMIIAILVLVTTTIYAEQVNVNVGGGKLINKSVIGITRSHEGSLELATEGCTVRGVSPGSFADTYDWKLHTGVIREPFTLPYLAEARDGGHELIFTANLLGTGPTAAWGSFVYTNTDIGFLSDLAADWVRYTNVIVPTYRVGSTLPAADQAIVNEITWAPKLLPSGAASTPKVTYWEISNEVAASVMDKATFNSRYKAIAGAMKAVDGTIKVGPAITTVMPSQSSEPVRGILQDVTTPVDFIAYHPYNAPIADPAIWANATQVEQKLRDLSMVQRNVFTNVYNTVVADRGTSAANAMQYLATEWNVVGFNYGHEQRSMANALGSAETIFTFADIGIRMAHEWMGTRDADFGMYPVQKVMSVMAEYMGDTLVSVYPAVNQHATSNHRLYVCRDSVTGKVSVWGINFSNTESWDVTIALSGVAAGKKATQMTLKCLQQPATLTMLHEAGVTEIDWEVQNLSGMNYNNFTMDIPAAGMAVMILDSQEANYNAPPMLAVDANSISRYVDKFDNTWAAYEVTGDKSGSLAAYGILKFDFNTNFWIKSGSSGGATYSAVTAKGIIDRGAAITSSIGTSAALSKIGVLAYAPRLDARISAGGSIVFADVSGTGDGSIKVIKFAKSGAATVLKSIAATDNAVINLSTIAELQLVQLKYGEVLAFEVQGNTAGHIYQADFSNMLIVDKTCWDQVGDLNGDCQVNLTDFANLATDWLETY